MRVWHFPFHHTVFVALGLFCNLMFFPCKLLEEKETEVDYRTVTVNTEQKVSEFYDVEERLGS